MENIEVSKKNKTNKLKLILIIVFIVIPMAVMTIIYFNNMTFKSKVNRSIAAFEVAGKLTFSTV